MESQVECINFLCFSFRESKDGASVFFRKRALKSLQLRSISYFIGRKPQRIYSLGKKLQGFNYLEKKLLEPTLKKRNLKLHVLVFSKHYKNKLLKYLQM